MANFSPAQDAFGRTRVSEPATLLDMKQLVSARADLFDDQQVSGGGTGSNYDATNAQTTLSVSAMTAGKRVRQSFRRAAYQPGKGQRAFFTGVMGNTVAGVTKRVGLFDDNDGYFFLQDADGWAVCVRKNGSDTVVRQANWNIACNSGVLRDPSKAQILTVDFEWLGVGIVRFGFSDDDGDIAYVHVAMHANRVTSVYTANPTLPVRYEIEADGANAANDSLVHICSSVESEGGRQFTGSVRAADRGITTLQTGVNTSVYPLLAIRLKSTHAAFSIVELNSFAIFGQDKTPFRGALLLNPTYTGTALSFSSAGTESAVEVARPTNATTIDSEGTLLASFYGETDGIAQIASQLGDPVQLGVAIDGTSDVLVVAVQNQTAALSDYLATVSWRESR